MNHFLRTVQSPILWFPAEHADIRLDSTLPPLQSDAQVTAPAQHLHQHTCVCRMSEVYGRVMRVMLGDQEWIVLSGLEEIKQFAMTQESTFHLPSRTFNEMYSFDEPLGNPSLSDRSVRYIMDNVRNYFPWRGIMEGTAKVCCQNIERIRCWKELSFPLHWARDWRDDSAFEWTHNYREGDTENGWFLRPPVLECYLEPRKAVFGKKFKKTFIWGLRAESAFLSF